jgi:hypothetical protein
MSLIPGSLLRLLFASPRLLAAAKRFGGVGSATPLHVWRGEGGEAFCKDTPQLAAGSFNLGYLII